MSVIQLAKQGHELEIWDYGEQWFVEVRGEGEVNLGPFSSKDEAYQEGRQYFQKCIAPKLDGQIPLVRYRKPQNNWESKESRYEGYAYHEAGHAVLDNLRGKRVTLVTIKSEDTDLPWWSDGQTKSEPGEKEVGSIWIPSAYRKIQILGKLATIYCGSKPVDIQHIVAFWYKD